MVWLGKLLGAFFGYMVAGPFGAIFGLILGHYFDAGTKGHWFFFPPPRDTHPQNIFFTATFTVMGYIAKSDGRVSENEIRVATEIMNNMLLTPKLKQEAIHHFQQGKRANFNLEETLALLGRSCYQKPHLLNMFMSFQFQAAYADGLRLSQNKQRLLEYVCHRLDLNPRDFFQTSFRYDYANSRQRQYQQYQPAVDMVGKAYDTLGVTRAVNNADLKKAYRKLMSKHHPDKLVSKGLSDDKIKLATQKTQEIKSAYEIICKARGI